jgi:uncharacterized protein
MTNEPRNDARKPWYHRGLRFECTGCSECCKSRGAYSHVYAGDRDAAAMARELGVTLREFEQRYAKFDSEGRREIRFVAGACVFLAKDGKCGVYRARPTQCRTFPFWRENLDAKVWRDEIAPGCEGVGEGKLHSRATIERIAREAEAE